MKMTTEPEELTTITVRSALRFEVLGFTPPPSRGYAVSIHSSRLCLSMRRLEVGECPAETDVRGGRVTDCGDNSATDGSGWGTARVVESFFVLELLELALRPFTGASSATLDREKGKTPARLAMSCSPSCQCIASAARQGIAISSAILGHISCLNL